jgi:hypothetical protein
MLSTLKFKLNPLPAKKIAKKAIKFFIAEYDFKKLFKN